MSISGTGFIFKLNLGPNSNNLITSGGIGVAVRLTTGLTSGWRTTTPISRTNNPTKYNFGLLSFTLITTLPTTYNEFLQLYARLPSLKLCDPLPNSHHLILWFPLLLLDGLLFPTYLKYIVVYNP